MKKIALEDLPITSETMQQVFSKEGMVWTQYVLPDGRIVWKLQPVKVRGLTPEPLFTLPSNILSPPQPIPQAEYLSSIAESTTGETLEPMPFPVVTSSNECKLYTELAENFLPLFPFSKYTPKATRGRSPHIYLINIHHTVDDTFEIIVPYHILVLYEHARNSTTDYGLLKTFLHLRSLF
jgi:hypothetical protein